MELELELPEKTTNHGYTAFAASQMFVDREGMAHVGANRSGELELCKIRQL